MARTRKPKPETPPLEITQEALRLAQEELSALRCCHRSRQWRHSAFSRNPASAAHP